MIFKVLSRSSIPLQNQGRPNWICTSKSPISNRNNNNTVDQ